MNQRAEVLDECPLVEVHAEQLRHLVDHDHGPIPALKPMRTGSEMKLAKNAEAQHAGQRQEHADQQRHQGHGGGDEGRRSPPGATGRDLGAHEDGDGGGGGDGYARELPKTA